MSMYLPNPDVRTTGPEAAEFLDLPPMAESHTGLVDDHAVDTGDARPAVDGLDGETAADGQPLGRAVA